MEEEDSIQDGRGKFGNVWKTAFGQHARVTSQSCVSFAPRRVLSLLLCEIRHRLLERLALL